MFRKKYLAVLLVPVPLLLINHFIPATNTAIAITGSAQPAKMVSAQPPPPPCNALTVEPGDIETFSIKSLRLGMTIDEAVACHSELKVEEIMERGTLKIYRATFDELQLRFDREKTLYTIMYKHPLTAEPDLASVSVPVFSKYGKPAITDRTGQIMGCWGDCLNYQVPGDEGASMTYSLTPEIFPVMNSHVFTLELVDPVRERTNEASWRRELLTRLSESQSGITTENQANIQF